LIGRQGTLWPEWRHFAFVTDLVGHPVDVDAFHREHPLAKLATGPPVGEFPAGGAPQKRASGADIDVHHLNAYVATP
jgi:hypothetical protein